MESGSALARALQDYAPQSDDETRDVERIRLLAAQGDPWNRSTPLHATASALVVHPDTARVLLRWHERMGSWLQVGGHGEAGETHPFDVARREAREETGIPDLASWPDPARPVLVHVAIVPVPPGHGEPAHEHADLRYLLATGRPAEVMPESRSAEVRWFSLDEARVAVGPPNTRETISRVGTILRRERGVARLS